MGSVSVDNPAVSDLFQNQAHTDPPVVRPLTATSLEQASQADLVKLNEAVRSGEAEPAESFFDVLA